MVEDCIGDRRDHRALIGRDPRRRGSARTRRPGACRRSPSGGASWIDPLGSLSLLGDIGIGWQTKNSNLLCRAEAAQFENSTAAMPRK